MAARRVKALGNAELTPLLIGPFRTVYCSSVHAMLNQAAVNDLKGESSPLEFNLQDVADTIEVEKRRENVNNEHLI